jgi:transaldolase
LAPAAPPASEGWQRDGDAGRNKVGSFCPIEGREKEGRLVLDSFRTAGIDLEKLAADLQSQGAKSFDESWQNLLAAVECKGKEMRHSS